MKNPPLFHMDYNEDPSLVPAQVTEITLRDLFAGLLMAGWAAGGRVREYSEVPACVEAAASAYAIANLMLEEREKEK